MAQINAGAAAYKPFTLRIYDTVVLGLSNKYIWRCPTKNVLLPFFQANTGHNHMDIGVGTGYFPASITKSHPKILQNITLVDLNPNTLTFAANRINRPDTTCINTDVLRPFTIPAQPRFDSISMILLLHCLSGTTKEKGRVFANVKEHLKDDGVLFGATVLGNGVRHSLVTRHILRLYNQKGIFHNHEDDEDGFMKSLEQEFGRVEGHVVGSVLLFRAWQPKR
ncbi:hypothetical protein ASPWEDRAFT_171879 [Aspergillus wentii DTO 134E9]|uniref:Methyltransferase type 12 domain-containing protein n=1 Tax=Aspergillus wentii DTO 134E9 TaxID=1073089 RepID=A0A1L9RJH7_ASPWE|nr:uncharacterized protein ASPWEDRAFT_171879 [Aspergillus wentii DTO 134E9]KAI9931993.1 hypothetical protein MW887_009495 [Aspergillus wentii]OJJ35051.1 hypothetical protein ASPWEDRAFT_171879 [Aspergillus wentii DTO 134E9]